MKKYLQKLGKKSHKAILKKIDTKTKDNVLLKFSHLLKNNSNKILKENKKDIKFATLKNINKNLITRLEINQSKLISIIKTIIDIAKLKDPVGIVLDKWQRPNGLKNLL